MLALKPSFVVLLAFCLAASAAGPLPEQDLQARSPAHHRHHHHHNRESTVQLDDFDASNGVPDVDSHPVKEQSLQDRDHHHHHHHHHNRDTNLPGLANYTSTSADNATYDEHYDYDVNNSSYASDSRIDYNVSNSTDASDMRIDYEDSESAGMAPYDELEDDLPALNSPEWRRRDVNDCR